MADEELLSETPEVQDAPSGTEQAEVETPELDTEGEQPEGESEEGQQAEEFEEIEIDGKTYQVPKDLKGSFLKNKDYTQGKQEIAATRKTLEAREAEIEERLKVTDEELEAKAELKGLEKRIAAYAKLTPEDWAHHRSIDPQATDNARDEYQWLKDQKAELSGKLSTAEAQRTQKAQQDLAKRVEDTLAAAPKIISNWNPAEKEKTIGGLMEFAASKNISEQTLKSLWSPTFLEILHLAKLGDQINKKQSAPKPRAPAVPPPEPIRTVKPAGATPPTGLSDRLSADEWARRRNAQVAKKG